MGALAEMFQDNGWAMMFGATGLACQLGWPLLRRRPAILIAQFGIGASYALHYACLEAWTGAAIASLGATQTCVAMLAGERRWAGKLGLAFFPLVALACCATWNGWASLLAMTACSFVMLGRMQSDILRLRIYALGAAPFGISHDIVVDAVPALIGAIFSASIAAVMLAREIRRRKAWPFPGSAARTQNPGASRMPGLSAA